MKILFAAGEAAPFFKTGGLGDVAYALPKELIKQGVDICVVLPYYSNMPEKYKKMTEDVLHFTVKVGWKDVYCGIKKMSLDGVTYYFIDNEDYFNRSSLYGDWDDGERFGFFSMAVIEMMEKVGFIPDVLHVNDWHTAMIPVLLVDKYHWIEAYHNIRKVITIHNIQFQGIFDPVILSSVFDTGMNIFHEGGVAFHGKVNFLKGGINFSDVVTTVSPTYANEIQTAEFGNGLEEVLQFNNWKIQGIINGIDYEMNNPETDEKIPYHFSVENRKGKEKNKLFLQERVGLPIDKDIPLLSSVSRLTDQKGFQLVQEKMEELLNTRKVQVLILGTGEKKYEDSFRYFEEKYPNQFKVVLDFDIELAQQIYAGSDLFLMPSAFEPCGLSQMMSLRYGTLPIVHETGGLKDTVVSYNRTTSEGTGFSFYDFNGYTMLGTIYRALDVYEKQPKAWNLLIEQGMKVDFSWENPAKRYIKIYESLL